MQPTILSPEQTGTIEKLFQTGDEHFDRYAFDLYLEVEKRGDFVDKSLPLQFFKEYTERLPKESMQPLEAVQGYLRALEEAQYTDEQKRFLLFRVRDYFDDCLFGDEVDIDSIRFLLKLNEEQLTPSPPPEPPKPPTIQTDDLRTRLRAVMLKELESLPETLESLEPKDRIKLMTKLMPFVFPKLQSINHWMGE